MKKIHLYFIFYFLIASCHQVVNDDINTPISLDFSGVLTQKIDSVSNLILLDSVNAPLYFDRAAFYMKNNDLNLGVSDLKKAIKLDSTNAKYWLKLGVLNYAMQESRSAKDCWELCCQIDATNIDCRINLAVMYLAVGELEKGQKR